MLKPNENRVFWASNAPTERFLVKHGQGPMDHNYNKRHNLKSGQVLPN